MRLASIINLSAGLCWIWFVWLQIYCFLIIPRCSCSCCIVFAGCWLIKLMQPSCSWVATTETVIQLNTDSVCRRGLLHLFSEPKKKPLNAHSMNVDASLHPLPVLMESERMVTLRVVPGASVGDVLFEPPSCLEGSREFIRMLLPRLTGSCSRMDRGRRTDTDSVSPNVRSTVGHWLDFQLP